MPTPRPHLTITHEDLLAITRLMEGAPFPWYVSGGWAIDVFLGRMTRRHEDLEIGVARRDQGLLHARCRDWRLYKIAEGPEGPDLFPWQEGEWLELPVFQIVAQQEGGQPPEFEFFLNEVWDGELRFRKQPSIRRPIEESYLRTDAGIPVLAPEIQLLYKSCRHADKDEHDFREVLPALSAERRRWLREALMAYRPGDPWLRELEDGFRNSSL